MFEKNRPLFCYSGTSESECLQNMTIAALLSEAKKRLGPQGDLLGAEVLLAFVLSKGREYLIAHAEEVLADAICDRFGDLFGRFYAGEPVAYLTNSRAFYGLDFYVDQRVLIPRPETELLVSAVLDFVNSRKQQNHESLADGIRILDVGTGSGCIAVALATHLPQAKITAVDISTEALAVARINAQKHGVIDRIHFLQSDLLEGIANEQKSDEHFDIVVANLPYIGEKRFNFVSRETRAFEPHVALFGGEDGLRLYERMFVQLQQKEWQPQLLLGEFGFLQVEEMKLLIRQFFPDNHLEILQDYAKIERIFILSHA